MWLFAQGQLQKRKPFAQKKEKLTYKESYFTEEIISIERHLSDNGV
jgi:hypothetical protein